MLPYTLIFTSFLLSVAFFNVIYPMKNSFHGSKTSVVSPESSLYLQLIEHIFSNTSNKNFTHLLSRIPRDTLFEVRKPYYTTILGYACVLGHIEQIKKILHYAKNRFTKEEFYLFINKTPVCVLKIELPSDDPSIEKKISFIQTPFYSPLHLVCASIFITEKIALKIVKLLMANGASPYLWASQPMNFPFTRSEETISFPHHLPLLIAHFRGWSRIAYYLSLPSAFLHPPVICEVSTEDDRLFLVNTMKLSSLSLCNPYHFWEKTIAETIHTLLNNGYRLQVQDLCIPPFCSFPLPIEKENEDKWKALTPWRRTVLTYSSLQPKNKTVSAYPTTIPFIDPLEKAYTAYYSLDYLKHIQGKHHEKNRQKLAKQYTFYIQLKENKDLQNPTIINKERLQLAAAVKKN